ncbi:MAG: SAM-dependent methyltransferase [Leptothrix sp. (in: b-proteobacteria)]
MFTELISDPAADSAAPDARARFLRLLQTALATGSLVRLTLSRYHGALPDLERLLARPVQLRGQACLQLVYRHTSKDITKNHPNAEALDVLAALIGPDFQNAHLQTDRQEVQLTVKRKGGRDKSLLRVGKLAQDPARPDEPETAEHSHNRVKHRPLQLSAPYWTDLGVTTPQRQLVPSMARKWKQINKFVEIFASAVESSTLAARPAQELIRVLDFGCGKGYLTFAVHDYLQNHQHQPKVTGVELREELVKTCNDAVRNHGLSGLDFDAGDVRHYTRTGVDVMIALHACDIATDHAIHFGLRAGASIIMCSPCCHKQIRPQIKTPPLLRPLLQHGVHLGQEAEMVTDSLRALLLDAAGYDTQVFEFISLEHTNKNKMILAVQRPQQTAGHAETVLRQIEEIKQFYGIREHCLQTLLQADPAEAVPLAC